LRLRRIVENRRGPRPRAVNLCGFRSRKPNRTTHVSAMVGDIFVAGFK